MIALGLDDPSGRAAVADDAADEVARDVMDAPGVEGRIARIRREPRAARRQSAASSRMWRAWASWSRTRASEVPPSETFASTEAPSASAS